jgi:hypothetical protein
MVTRNDVLWKVSPIALTKISPIRKSIGEEAYKKDVDVLKDKLCEYFSTELGCTKELGKTISPLGIRTQPGWKTFKVRGAYTGCGASGGFRFAIAVHCKERKVNICGAWLRKEDPTNAEFAEVLEDPDI